MPRSHELLTPQSSRLVVIDMQEKLLAAMSRAAVVTDRCRLLIRGASLLGVPVDITEQYPKGLGPTVPALRDLADTPLEKLRFSAESSLSWANGAPGANERHQIVLAGIETHVCVLQTAFDLLSTGYRVFLAVDACCSRADTDRDFALRRLAAAGVVLTTVESTLFEWCESAEHPSFKSLSRLVTGRE